MNEEKKNIENNTQPKKTGLLSNKLFIIGLITLAVCWLLSLTSLGSLIFGFNPTETLKFQDLMIKISIIATVVFIIYVFLIVFDKNKTIEIQQKEGNAIILVDSYTQYRTIKEVAKEYEGLFLGNCIKYLPITPFKESGATPVSAFFVFENIYNNEVISYSLWKQNYVRKITTNLLYRDFIGRNTIHKHWTGESREESYRGIANTAASKKLKELKHIKSDEDEEGSMTE